MSEHERTTLYCARRVLPIASEAIEDGAVAVRGTRIAGVGSRAELVEKFPAHELRDYGEAVILPGFVNAHSHLELSAMRGFLEREEPDFFSWLRKLTVTRKERMTAEDHHLSALWGAVEAARAGVTCMGDASDGGYASLRALKDVGLRGIVYQEAFGPDPGAAREQVALLRDKVAQLRTSETALAQVGISPHAPYTVSAPMFEMMTDYALAEKLPVMIHAAESRAEEQLLREGRGAFAESLAARNIAFDAPGVSTVQYLARLGVLRARPLLAHCIRTDETDVQTIKEHGARVAHCPKSNAKFGHGHAPLGAFLRARLDVGLGSDSVASNNTCDMLEEARFAVLASRAAGEIVDDAGNMAGSLDALRLATTGGARALGLDALTGALVAGLEADFVVVALDGAHQMPVYDAAAALVFSSSARDVLLTVVTGREVFRDGRVTSVDEDALRARLRELAQRL